MMSNLDKHWDLLHSHTRKPLCVQGLSTVEREIKRRADEDERKKRSGKQMKKKTGKTPKGSRRKKK
eukprot:12833625-Ditylum_brightwellii.AAC.1